MSSERRHFSRVTFHTAAQLLLDDQSMDVVVLDLSLKGALVRLPAGCRPDKGTPCTFKIKLDTVGDVIRMEMRVTHHEGDYAGLACDAIDLDSITHLRRLVELNIGSSELLDRELAALRSQ